MKNILKKAILPVAVFGIAIVTAFATNINKKLVDPIYQGPFYFHDEVGCQEITPMDPEVMDCTTQFTGNICTWLDGANHRVVFGKEPLGIDCTIVLYKRN